ncbi:hypothetical protein PVK06_012238 [Gossypium arboreum]|uniref:Uncharacterized protein n=1 Tax=Gossypium arboreum TaxID=29729 RepID=A0ABR0QBQ1_GOSAR|nr:hypothetical protein PVK06_012238 [Gossypium arboreum]
MKNAAKFSLTVCCIAVRLRKGSSRKSGRDSAEKKEPMTPSSDRPTRERKVVERYSAPSVARSSSSKTLSIEKGRGTQLKDIPNGLLHCMQATYFKMRRKYYLNAKYLHRDIIMMIVSYGSLKKIFEERVHYVFPMVLYGLEYAHTISHIKGALVEAMPRTKLELIFANVMCSIINLLEDHRKSDRLGYLGSFSSVNSLGAATCTRCSLGGLIWDLLEGRRMEDYLLLWIGPDNSAFSNIVLTFNGCEIVRYDATEEQLVTNVSQQKMILKRSVMFSSTTHVRKLHFWMAKSS